jgi:hypothetical protein
MEFLLLWVDDLDDAIGALRHKAPAIIGFLFALALFAGTGFALVVAPQTTLAVLAVIAPASLIAVARRRRAVAAAHNR